jgi:uncharacterized membrane protein YhhN
MLSHFKIKPLTFLLLGIFAVSLAADCYFILQGQPSYRIVSKSILMPVLLGALLSGTYPTTHRIGLFYLIGALVFSFIGDLFLLREGGEILFIFGLSSFLITHLFYILFFFRIHPVRKKNRLFYLYAGILIGGYLVYLLSRIWMEVAGKGMEIPVLVYALTIGMMLLAAAQTVTGHRFKILALLHFIPGALLFVISDSLLAIDKFAGPLTNAGIIIMLTYGAAQFLLITGGIRLLRK